MEVEWVARMNRQKTRIFAMLWHRLCVYWVLMLNEVTLKCACEGQVRRKWKHLRWKLVRSRKTFPEGGHLEAREIICIKIKATFDVDSLKHEISAKCM